MRTPLAARENSRPSRYAFVAAAMAVIFVSVVYFTNFMRAHSESEERLAVALQPGECAQISAYIKAGDDFELAWTTKGTPIAYEYGAQKGHGPRTFEAGEKAARGKLALNADHGGLYGAAFRNTAAIPVVAMIDAQGQFVSLQQRVTRGRGPFGNENGNAGAVLPLC